MKKKHKTTHHRHPLADLYTRLAEIDNDLDALKPYERGYPEVRDNRQDLRKERNDVEATITALEKGS